jgi:hypothetical protein
MHEVALRLHDARQDAKLSFEDRVRAQVQLGNEECDELLCFALAFRPRAQCDLRDSTQLIATGAAS